MRGLTLGGTTQGSFPTFLEEVQAEVRNDNFGWRGRILSNQMSDNKSSNNMFIANIVGIMFLLFEYNF